MPDDLNALPEDLALPIGPDAVSWQHLEAADAGDGGPRKLPRVTMRVYSGGPMTLRGWPYPVVIALDGLDYETGSHPLLLDHKPADRVGHATKIEIAAGTLYVAGVVSCTTAAAKEVLADARNGFPWQASLGARPDRVEFLAEGREAKINGKTVRGPAHLVHQSVLGEVSFVPRGADTGSAARVAAEASQKGRAMPESTPPATDTQTPDQIRAAERDRLQAIDAACRGLQGPDVEAWRKEAIQGEMSLDELNGKLLDKIKADRPRAPAPLSDRATPASTDVIAAAAAGLAGCGDVVEKQFPEQVRNRADDLRARSFIDLAAAALRLEGRDVPRGTGELIRAAFSTYALPTALGSAAEKTLLQSYTEAPATWESFAFIGDAKDFREQQAIRPSWTGQMEQVAPGGELKHGSLDEAATGFRVDTFGKILGVTRQDIINDDMGFLNDTARAYGRMARRGVSDLAWSVILANAGGFFHADHGNLMTGADTDLDAASLEQAVGLMRAQRDADGNDLDLAPKVLVVPPGLEITARRLLASMEVQASEAGEPTGNALRDIAALEVEGRISNTGKFANGSATAWFLFAAPSAAGVIIAFLQGRRTPTVEFFGLESDPDTLGVRWRVYHDYGAALADWRAAVRSDGV
ncbi:MAG: Mu-like prophage major head subunit gpT family protein [Phycisphaerae bacterium]